MYGNNSDRQKLRWGALGQCLLIALSFLPVWLLSSDDIPDAETKTADTLTINEHIQPEAAESSVWLNVPRP